MTKYSSELMERVVALVRDIGATHPDVYGKELAGEWVVRARSIISDLPVPLDPDLLIARQIARAALDGAHPDSIAARQIGLIDADAGDGLPIVEASLASIKRGRELAQEQQA